MDELEELYEQNARTVYRFLLSRCRDEQLAEDLTQETFLQAYRSLDRYNGECRIGVWLCQIAKHLWYRHMAKHKREIPLSAENEFIPDVRDTEGQVLARVELLDVLKDMQRLPAQMREVMYLRITGSLSFKDIGDILGRSENWARVNFYRGKEALLRGRAEAGDCRSTRQSGTARETMTGVKSSGQTETSFREENYHD